MANQRESAKKLRTLNAIVVHARELPAEGQELLLMMAKAMRYTRDCVEKEKIDKVHEKVERREN